MLRSGHLLRLIPACFAAVLVAGCAGYQLGTGSAPKFSTLFIAPVRSETQVPQAVALVTTQLREAIIKDGRVRLVDSAADADATLQVALTGYDRAVSVARADDTGLARRFDVSLHAAATLTDNRSKTAYFTRRPLVATRGAFTDGGLVQAEYQVLPLLAEQLAGEAAHAMLDTW